MAVAREELAKKQVVQTYWVAQGVAGALLTAAGADPTEWAWEYDEATDSLSLTKVPTVRLEPVETNPKEATP